MARHVQCKAVAAAGARTNLLSIVFEGKMNMQEDEFDASIIWFRSIIRVIYVSQLSRKVCSVHLGLHSIRRLV